MSTSHNLEQHTAQGQKQAPSSTLQTAKNGYLNPAKGIWMHVNLRPGAAEDTATQIQDWRQNLISNLSVDGDSGGY